MKLDKRIIVDAALAILDEDGLDKLTLRAVAKALDVQAMSLYWHIPDKQGLLRAMAMRIFAKAYKNASNEKEVWSWLNAFGQSLKSELIAHRDSARLMAISQPEVVEPETRYRNAVVPLTSSGIDIKRALSYESCTISFVVGWTIFYQNNEYKQHLQEYFDFQDSFTIGLGSLIAGMKIEEEKYDNYKVN